MRRRQWYSGYAKFGWRHAGHGGGDDKDRTAALLPLELKTDALLLLTDVAAVFKDHGGPDQRALGATTADALDGLELAPGSMGRKVAAA
jgi:carbamate kinase